MIWIALPALLLLLVAWVVFPLGAAFLSRRQPAPAPASPAEWPSVSVVIATRDESFTMARRVANLREADYPADRLEVVVGVDRTAREPLEAYARLLPGVRCVPGDAPGGKAVTLNAAAAAATGEVLVFADSQQLFDPNAITELVRYLAPGIYGAASGLYLPRANERRGVLDLFWTFELGLRRSEARVHSVVGVSGSIYAIRKSLWHPLPAQLINDDLFVPLEVARSGHRVGFCETAIARDSRVFTRQQEFNRRVRTLTGVLQLCAWRPWLLVPWGNPVWVPFVCHKLLRVATPYLGILLCLAAIPWMLELPVALWIGLGVLLGGGLLGFGLLRPSATRWLLTQAGWALGLLAAPVLATANAVRGRWNVWHQPKVSR